jgi:GT2 family glycosyltransferase
MRSGAEADDSVRAALATPVDHPCDITVIIGTRNRAASLRETLGALAGLPVPAGLTVELFLVDNGSTDATRELCQAMRWPGVDVHHLYVAEAGLARAQNAALRQSRGRVVMFTDDDVRPPVDWIARLSAPILAGEADAVGGGVRIPPEAKQPWTTMDHEEWLASTEHWEPGREPVLVGANMAIARDVFAALGGFDEDLSQAIDTLFSYRLVGAGFRLVLRHDVVVDHHVEPERFTRAGLTRQAAARAHTHAFEMRHVVDWRPRLPVVRWLRARWRLVRLRARLAGPLTNENLAMPEMRLIQEVAFWPLFMRRRREPRRYTIKRGG